jgi:acetyl esterase/lipase
MRLKVLLVSLALAALACRRGALLGAPAAAPTPAILADTFFSGRAFIDSNANRQLDSGDAPLESARFSAGSFGALTGKDGHATIVIPGNWDKPTTAQMAPPKDSSYTLLGPTEVELSFGGSTSADFLFAAPAGASAALQPTPGNQPALPDALNAPGSLQRNLTYCAPLPGVELKMDVYQPERIDGPSPVVVYVHGGGWTSGDKDDELARLFGRALNQRGYLMASINYRLAPQYRFPAPIEDVKCAVRYLRANAAAYQLDPQRIAALGASAGGHLVALLGTSDAEQGFDVGEYLEQSSRVQAVVDLFGPAELIRLMAETYRGFGERGFGERIFGVNAKDATKIAPFSPVTYITSDDPPFLILHGERDELVPIEQSEILYDQLTKAGIPAQFVRVQNAGHGFLPVGGEISPRLVELVRIVIEFLDQYLK